MIYLYFYNHNPYVRHTWSLWGSRHVTTCEVEASPRRWKSSSSGNSGTVAASSDFRHDGARCCDGHVTVSRVRRGPTFCQMSTDTTGRSIMMQMCQCRLFVTYNQNWWHCHHRHQSLQTTITIAIYICIARLYSAVQGRLTVLQTVKHKIRTVKKQYYSDDETVKQLGSRGCTFKQYGLKVNF